MRNDEIRPCDVCCGKLCSTPGLPLAGARVTVQRLVIKDREYRTLAGLEAMLGPSQAGLAAARALTTGDVVEEPADLGFEVVICEKCLTERSMPILALAESAERQNVRRATYVR